MVRPRQWGRGRAGWKDFVGRMPLGLHQTVLSQQNLVGPRWTVSLDFDP